MLGHILKTLVDWGPFGLLYGLLYFTISLGNYTTVNVEVESDSEIENVNVIQEDILLNIETVENLYKNSELVLKVL